jgi:hypothetical protein
MLATLVGYVIAAIVFLRHGWLIRAGLAMMLVSLVPLLWQAIFTDSDAKGYGFLLMLMLPPALLLVLLGCLIAAIRLGLRLWQSHRSATG